MLPSRSGGRSRAGRSSLSRPEDATGRQRTKEHGRIPSSPAAETGKDRELPLPVGWGLEPRVLGVPAAHAPTH
ncbi:unnamed protein product [Urochloa humidicola]